MGIFAEGAFKIGEEFVVEMFGEVFWMGAETLGGHGFEKAFLFRFWEMRKLCEVGKGRRFFGWGIGSGVGMGEALENIGVGDAVVACAAEVDFVIDLADEVFLLEDLGFEGGDFGEDGGKVLGAPGLEVGAIFVEKPLPVSVCSMESG